MTESTEEVVRTLEAKRYHAMLTNDMDAFATLAHPELHYVHSSAAVDDRDSYIAKCREGYYIYHRIEHPVDAIIVLADTVLVFGEMSAQVTVDGQETHLHTRTLAVWQETPGGWALRAFQPTVIPTT